MLTDPSIPIRSGRPGRGNADHEPGALLPRPSGDLLLEPGLERYLSTGHHDDARGVFATYMADHPTRQGTMAHFLVNTPTIVATVDAALAAAIVALGLQAANAPRALAAAGAAATFALVWGTLLRLQLLTMRPLRHQTPRFPTPPEWP